MKTTKRYFVAEHFEATAKGKSIGCKTFSTSYLGKQCMSLPYTWESSSERDSIMFNYSYSTVKGAKKLIENRKKVNYQGQYTRTDEIIELSIEYEEQADDIKFNCESAKVVDTVYIDH